MSSKQIHVNMEDIPTAKAFAKLGIPKGYDVSDFLTDGDIFVAMREFAKLHVQAALIAAGKKATTYTKTESDGYECWDVVYVDENSILSSYPLTKIK